MDVDALRWRMCDCKTPMGRAAAMTVAERERSLGTRVSAYRCPFGDHWHIGHAPSMRTLDTLAAFLRERHAA